MMEGDHFGDGFDDFEEAMRIVVDLAMVEIENAARVLPELIQRARAWRLKHVTSVE